jgi:hypothetical protein
MSSLSISSAVRLDIFISISSLMIDQHNPNSLKFINGSPFARSSSPHTLAKNRQAAFLPIVRGFFGFFIIVPSPPFAFLDHFIERSFDDLGTRKQSAHAIAKAVFFSIVDDHIPFIETQMMLLQILFSPLPRPLQESPRLSLGQLSLHHRSRLRLHLCFSSIVFLVLLRAGQHLAALVHRWREGSGGRDEPRLALAAPSPPDRIGPEPVLGTVTQATDVSLVAGRVACCRTGSSWKSSTVLLGNSIIANRRRFAPKKISKNLFKNPRFPLAFNLRMGNNDEVGQTKRNNLSETKNGWMARVQRIFR